MVPLEFEAFIARYKSKSAVGVRPEISKQGSPSMPS